MSTFDELNFMVLGHAAPQGSKTNMRQTFRSGKTINNTVEDNPNVTPWRKEVRDAAWRAFQDGYQQTEPRALLDGPLLVTVTFIFVRPASHYGTGRNAGVLKESAPDYPIGAKSGDVDKLLRAIHDAMTGVVYRDDCQVALAQPGKYYGEPECAIVRVQPMQGGPLLPLPRGVVLRMHEPHSVIEE